MKVKCINIYNDFLKEYVTENPYLTIGNEYLILEVSFYSNDILYRLVGDNSDNSPGLYDAKQFEVISGKMPSNWEISQPDATSVILSPKAWRERGFWEKCYDYDPAAMEIYRREARIIMEECNED